MEGLARLAKLVILGKMIQDIPHFPAQYDAPPHRRHWLVGIKNGIRIWAVPIQISQPTNLEFYNELVRRVWNNLRPEAVGIETEAGGIVCQLTIYDFVKEFFKIKTITLDHVSAQLVLRLAA